MMISTIEYYSLFGNKNPNEITNEDIQRERKKVRKERQSKNNNNSFRTFEKVGIKTDEFGNETVGIIECTGFEMEN